MLVPEPSVGSKAAFSETGTESSLLSAQGWFWTYSMSLGYVSVGSGDSDSQVTGPESTYLAGLFFLSW